MRYRAADGATTLAGMMCQLPFGAHAFASGR
jgi:hypothetical protein